MNGSGSSFSDRFGYQAPEAEITIREDAPTPVRDGILMAGYGANLSPGVIRDILCRVLLQRPDQDNWSASNTFARAGTCPGRQPLGWISFKVDGSTSGREHSVTRSMSVDKAISAITTA